ncbi:expressed unknown protein [Seminavis robusta]|uniref:DUF6824 domain-containing protein n=1 Tax=Seminavis robusta TaxID=568900 RepID=A0A9N8H4C0_9STRA|nr:expressed unknown protein [Seminavis robusta]|eukprot:Sro110_g054860.1 n/a (755) ;mRNA; r:46364-48868
MVDSVESTNLGDYPLKDIPHPHPHDVLCGRGGGSNNWIGNSHWRMLVAANKQLYVTLPKRQKMLLSRSIVHAVRSQNPPGRFLQKDSKSDRWYDIGDQRAQEKTSQALREGAPELRTKLKDDKPPARSTSKSSVTGVPLDSRSDDGAKSPAPSEPDAPSNPPSRAASGTVNAPQLAQQTSTTSSVGQVLPPPSGPVTATASGPSLPPQAPSSMPPSSMPPPAMRPPLPTPPAAQQQDSNQTRNHQQQQNGQPSPQQQQQQQRQAQQQHQQQQQQQFQQQQQQFPQGMPGMMPMMQNGMAHMMQPGQQMMNGTPVYFAAGPNMSPMPMYPTMMMNQQGMMVPVMSMVPPSAMMQNQQGGNNNNNQNNNNSSGDQHHQKSKANGSNNHDNNKSKQNQFQQFDQKLDGLALPPDGLEAGGLSFGSVGSIMMTENEMSKLQQGGGYGNGMGFNNAVGHGNNNNNNIMSAQRQHQQFLQHQYLQQQQQFMEQYQQQQQQLAQHGHMPSNFGKMSDDDMAKFAPPPEGGLEPQGLSFGSVSLMSIGDAKLEATGVSFGSAMSFNMTPNMVDGGLDGIGMSFGSMTLGTTNEEPYDPQQNQHNIMPPPPSGPKAAQSTDTLPTLFQQNRSSVNLLDCSDTESDDEEQSAQRSQHKNLEWEKMKSFVQSGVPEPVPLPTQNFPSSFAIPNMRFQRDVSQMSQLSAGEPGENNDANLHSLMAAAMPPPPPKKQDDDGEWQNAELLMLKTQQSGTNNSRYGGQR